MYQQIGFLMQIEVHIPKHRLAQVFTQKHTGSHLIIANNSSLCGI